LWILFGLFVLRVLGQALVVFLDVGFLPPKEYLLPAQLLIVVLMARICVDFTRRRGFFFQPKRFFATAWLWFGYLYLAAMVARAIFVWDRPIPIVFHWVLAAFVITVGLSHRQRLGA
jgi:hypothetical protein